MSANGRPGIPGPSHAEQPSYWVVFLVAMIRAALKQPDTARAILLEALARFDQYAPPHLKGARHE